MLFHSLFDLSILLFFITSLLTDWSEESSGSISRRQRYAIYLSRWKCIVKSFSSHSSLFQGDVMTPHHCSVSLDLMNVSRYIKAGWTECTGWDLALCKPWALPLFFPPSLLHRSLFLKTNLSCSLLAAGEEIRAVSTLHAFCASWIRGSSKWNDSVQKDCQITAQNIQVECYWEHIQNKKLLVFYLIDLLGFVYVFVLCLTTLYWFS